MPNQVITSITLVVNDPLTVTSPAPPEATVNQFYSHTFTASGGIGSVTWAHTGGTLPPGLSLSSNGVLSGTPTSSGSYNFDITVTDSA